MHTQDLDIQAIDLLDLTDIEVRRPTMPWFNRMPLDSLVTRTATFYDYYATAMAPVEMQHLAVEFAPAVGAARF